MRESDEHEDRDGGVVGQRRSRNGSGGGGGGERKGRTEWRGEGGG